MIRSGCSRRRDLEIVTSSVFHYGKSPCLHLPISALCVLVCSVVSNSLRPHGFLSVEFSRQEYWSGFPFPTQRIFLIQGSNPCLICLLHWQMDSLSLHELGSPICALYLLATQRQGLYCINLYISEFSTVHDTPVGTQEVSANPN